MHKIYVFKIDGIPCGLITKKGFERILQKMDIGCVISERGNCVNLTRYDYGTREDEPLET